MNPTDPTPADRRPTRSGGISAEAQDRAGEALYRALAEGMRAGLILRTPDGLFHKAAGQESRR